MAKILYPMKEIFKQQPDLAWDILEAQTNLQICPSEDGRQVANLLALYMRAVEILNSVQDKRQEFFKSKMSGLMLRPNVIKSINSTSFKTITHKGVPEEPAVRQKPNDASSRKQHLEMQVAYETDKHSKDSLTRMIAVEYSRMDRLKQKIEQVVSQSQKKIDNRIRIRRQVTFENRQDKRQVGLMDDSDEDNTTEDPNYDSPTKLSTKMSTSGQTQPCPQSEAFG